LEVLNFANLNNDVNIDALEKLVGRCKSLKTLKVNKSVTLEQFQRLLVLAPQLCELGSGSFSQELTCQQYLELESAFNNCKSLHTLSGLWVASASAQYIQLQVLYSACTNLTFLNFSYALVDSEDLTDLLVHCPNLRRLWV
jgi:transport inhibitor response 1